MKLVRWLAAGLVAGVMAGAAWGQAYPNRPVKIVVPYPPGGVTDLFARALGAQMQESMGQPFLVENRPGASQMVGAVYVAKSPPDGYTLYVGSITSLAMNAYTQKSIQYDPVKDFAAVSLGMTMPMFLVVNPSTVPAQNVKELIALLKANPGKFTYSTTGNGSSTHMAGELFKLMTGTDMVAIPYKGSAPGIADVVAGQVHLSIDPGSSTLPFVKSGKLRALAVTGLQRFSQMPDLPTMAEAGVPGYAFDPWFGLLASSKVPRPVVAKLNREVVRILGLPDVKKQLLGMGAEPMPTTPEAFDAQVRDEIRKFAKLARDANIKVE